MTKQEFTERTKVEVNDNEFETINEFYMYCECDKDEFCKMWCKMNPNRVKEEKKQLKKEKEDAANLDILYKFWEKWNGNVAHYYDLIAYTKITTKEIEAMSYFGVRYGSAETIGDVLYKVSEVIKHNK